MKIKCMHGYFIFEETKVGQISDFMSLYELDIVPKHNYFTFADLEDVPEYSIEGGEFLGGFGTKTFAGLPWEVMRENGIVYDFSNGIFVPIESVTQLIEIQLAGNRYISSGLILPGSVTEDGSRVTDYAAWYSRDTQRFTYTEVSFD